MSTSDAAAAVEEAETNVSRLDSELSSEETKESELRAKLLSMTSGGDASFATAVGDHSFALDRSADGGAILRGITGVGGGDANAAATSDGSDDGMVTPRGGDASTISDVGTPLSPADARAAERLLAELDAQVERVRDVKAKKDAAAKAAAQAKAAAATAEDAASAARAERENTALALRESSRVAVAAGADAGDIADALLSHGIEPDASILLAGGTPGARRAKEMDDDAGIESGEIQASIADAAAQAANAPKTPEMAAAATEAPKEEPKGGKKGKKGRK